MIRAPGPLMIDTLRREGYQADTNMFTIGFFKEMAEALTWQAEQTGVDGCFDCDFVFFCVCFVFL